MSKLVRMKPYNPGLNNVTKRYHYKGFLFREDQGWYEVADNLAAELKQLKTPVSPHTNIFDVKSKEEAKALVQQEKLAALPPELRNTPDNAKPISSGIGRIDKNTVNLNPFADDDVKEDEVNENIKLETEKPAGPKRKPRKAKKKVTTKQRTTKTNK